MQRKSIIPINGQLYSMLIVSALSMGTLPSFAENSLTVQNVLQSKKVKGLVTDVNGEPIIGATVTLKGTNQRTVTDLDGNFELPNVTKGGWLYPTSASRQPSKLLHDDIALYLAGIYDYAFDYL